MCQANGVATYNVKTQKFLKVAFMSPVKLVLVNFWKLDTDAESRESLPSHVAFTDGTIRWASSVGTLRL
jgi:hypothetical protein